MDCGVKNEDVSEGYIPEERDEHYNVTKESESVDLCPACLKKRNIEEDQEEETPGFTATGSNAPERTIIQTAKSSSRSVRTRSDPSDLAGYEN